MLTLITGGSGSGKSEFAEDLSVSYKSNNFNLYCHYVSL